jgi:7,8-dihydroneopterin aldolase/epimerase/oxygenase
MLSGLPEFFVTRCRRVFLRRYDVPVRIGVNHSEKHGPQRVRFSVDLFVLLERSTPKSDQLNEILDYDIIRAAIAQRVGRGHINLLETLCDDIAAALLANESIMGVIVKAEKPDVYPDCESVGVEVFRAKPVP